MGTIARDIMSSEILNATIETTIEEAIKLLVNNRITGLPVVDKEGKMVGIVSEYDLIVQISSYKKSDPGIFSKPIDFSKKIEQVQETTDLDKVVELFVNSRFRRLPVVNELGRLVGIITRRDLMRMFYYRAKFT